MRRVVLLRKAFDDLKDVRRDPEMYSMDMLEQTTDAVAKAQKQFKRDRQFRRRANGDEFIAVLDEVIQDLCLIQQKLREGT